MKTIPMNSIYKAAFENAIELVKKASLRKLTDKEQRHMNESIEICRCYERHHGKTEV